MAITEAIRAAPRIPPTAPPTTAVLSAGHCVLPKLLALLSQAALGDGCVEDVVLDVIAVPVALAAVAEDRPLRVTVLVGRFNVPMSRLIRALGSSQQFLSLRESRQQNLPVLQGRTFHTLTLPSPIRALD